MRRERHWVGCVLILFLAGAVPLGMTGCETWGGSSTADKGPGWCPICKDYHRHEVAHTSRPAPQAPAPRAAAPAPAPAPAPAAPPVMSTADGLRWSTLAYPTGNRSTSSLLLEKGVPAGVQVGEEFEYILKVTNLTDMNLTDVSVLDEVPANMRMIEATPNYKSRIENNISLWIFNNLGPRETKVIRVRAMANDTTVMTACSSAKHDTVLCVEIPVVEPKIQLTKTITPTDCLTCDPITMKIVVTNPGSGTARNVVVRDTLPDGLVTADNQGEIVANIGNLGPGQSRTVTANLKAQRGGNYDNRATVTADGGLSAEASASTMVRECQLAITKTGTEQSYLGRGITYQIVVKNVGNGEARNTVVQDTLPGNATFVSASDGGTVAGNSLQWNLGTLAAGQEKTLTVKLSGAQAGTVVNKATAQAHCCPPVSAQAQTTVSGIPAVLLEVVDVADPIEVGNNETYVITVTNQGSAPDTNIQIVCELEEQEEYVSSSGVTQGSAAGRTITFAPLASLAPKARATWQVVVKAVGAGDVRFKVIMNTDQLTRPVQETESTHLYQ